MHTIYIIHKNYKSNFNDNVFNAIRHCAILNILSNILLSLFCYGIQYVCPRLIIKYSI